MRYFAVIALAGITLTLVSCEPIDDPTGLTPRADQLILDQEEIHLHSLGQQIAFLAIVLDRSGNEMSDVQIEWTTSDPDVLAHEGGGAFRSMGNGTAEVIASVVASGGSSRVTPGANAMVHVAQVPAIVEVAPPSLVLWAIGQQVGLEASAADAMGTPMAEAPAFGWSAGAVDALDDNPAVAVDQAGLVTALTDGHARVTTTAPEGANGEEASADSDVEVRASFSLSACAVTQSPEEPAPDPEMGEEDSCATLSLTVREEGL